MARGFKKRTFRSRAKGRKGYRASSMSTRKAAFSALRKVNKVKKQIERKTAITQVVATTIGPPGGSQLLQQVTGVATGDGRDDREGNKISPTSMHIWGYLQWNSAGGNDQWVRMMVIQDRATQSTSNPTVHTGTTATDLMASNSFMSEFNLQTRNRYKVLYSKHYKFNTAKNVGEAVYFSKRFKLPSVVEFNGNGVNDRKKNACWMVMYTGSSGTTYPITINYSARMNYTDL